VGTHQDNVEDYKRKGRYALIRGERHALAKLTEDKVLEIRRRYCPGDPVNCARALAKKMGVTRRTIRYVVKKLRWGHVP
jgi:hypothetical protein